MLARGGPLLGLWVSTGLSVLGTTIALLVLPWFVLELTGSAAQVGVVAAAELAGLVLLSAAGGPLADRFGGRRTAMVSDLAGAAVVVAIPLVHALAGLRGWQLVWFALLVGACRAPGLTARRALVPELVALAGVPLERGSGAVDAAGRTAQLLGGPVGGALLTVLPGPAVLACDAVFFLVGAGTLAVSVPGSTATPGSAAYLGDLRAGLERVVRDRLLLRVTLLLLFVNTLDMAATEVFHPVYAAEVLRSPVALGAITGVLTGAALLGNLLYSWFGHRLSRFPLFVLTLLASGAPRYVALAARPGLPAVLAVLAVAGLLSGALNPLLAVVVYERVEPAMRSRVVGLTTAVSMGGTPLGALLGGALVDGVGLVATLWAVAVLYLVAAVAPVVFGGWRELDRANVAGSLPD
ncbi:MFS transporter [Saccharopolyspora rosea]|uniref:MFS transporter n=1 Tax=Saccharopolyspora rosea TaxID=524884 RepID=UPI0021DA3AA6|nr:MFS transporter [Saccharopolyspora rosea]